MSFMVMLLTYIREVTYCLKNILKLQLTLSFVMVFMGFSQAFNNWGEKRTLSLFFLTSSILVF